MDQQNQVPATQKSGSFSMSTVTNIIVKIIPILVIVFLVLALVAFMFYTIKGITTLTFQGFINGFANAISACASNLFMAAVLAALYRITSKK